MNLYLYVYGGGYHLLALGTINIAVWVFTRRWRMDFLKNYWEQLTAFVILVMTLTRMRVDIDVLKEKVKTLFDLFNSQKKD